MRRIKVSILATALEYVTIAASTGSLTLTPRRGCSSREAGCVSGSASPVHRHSTAELLVGGPGLGQRLLAWCSTFFGVLTVYRVREEAEAKAEARRRGGAEARRRGGAEARRRGGAEARRRGGAEARRRGGAEARRRGGARRLRQEAAEARRRGGGDAQRYR